ncbi:DUF4123 domain-containing protein [Celerinatantimonas yamalensis]|uniref:DUF4123 domain-containing protein n=1 Tax=Celerinatantimonas yamalensis TaxID=559956 RepID=A0ABW9G7I9_9GAMM
MSYDIPYMMVPPEQVLYLLVDGGQVSSLAEQLYNLDGPLALEAIYMFEPYDELRAVSPYIIQAIPSVQQWFFALEQPTAGYFVSSSSSLADLADHFRQFIKVYPPYGSVAFFKMAHSEAAWVLFNDQVASFWLSIEHVWVPTRFGLQEMDSPFKAKAFADTAQATLTDWLIIDESQWQQLGLIVWRNTLDSIHQHVTQWFAKRLSSQEDPQAWLAEHAQVAYKRGFCTESDLLMYFNIIGLLGESAVTHEQAYPDIFQLLTEPSARSPSQRVDEAELLAEKYANQDLSV